jgi:hypothetical protein
MNYTEFLMCSSKKQYKTEQVALRTIKRLKHYKNLYTYKCPYCKKYHISHKRNK